MGAALKRSGWWWRFGPKDWAKAVSKLTQHVDAGSPSPSALLIAGEGTELGLFQTLSRAEICNNRNGFNNKG